jgi:hypothetical protein
MTSPLLVSIITDCHDADVRLRQEIRYSTVLLGAKATCYGIQHPIEAAGCIVDALDAGRESAQIIVANVAPREEKKYKNGCPFSYVRVGNAIVIGTPTVFGLLKQLGLATEVQETDVYEVCSKFLDETEARRISESQFRSYEYLPLLAKWIQEGQEFPTKTIMIESYTKQSVWFVDNFGNCKTTATEQSQLSEEYQKIAFYARLADVPVGEIAVIRGSSGYKDTRFLEIVIQGKNASKIQGLSVGNTV